MGSSAPPHLPPGSTAQPVRAAGRASHCFILRLWSVMYITFQALAGMLLREITVPGFQRHSKDEAELLVSKGERSWQKGQDRGRG